MNENHHQPDAHQLIYQVLHTGCRISDDLGHTTILSLYETYKEARGIFMRCVRSGQISEDTKIFFDKNKTYIEQMRANIKDPEEFNRTLQEYILFYALPDDCSIFFITYKNPYKFSRKVWGSLKKCQWVKSYYNGFLFWMHVEKSVPVIIAAQRDSTSKLVPIFVLIADRICFDYGTTQKYLSKALTLPALQPGFNWKNVISKRMKSWTSYIVQTAYKSKNEWIPSTRPGDYTVKIRDQFNTLSLLLQRQDTIITMTVNNVWPVQGDDFDFSDLYKSINKRFSRSRKKSIGSVSVNKQMLEIRLKNFVIKGGVSRCVYSHHKIIDINASLNVLTKDHQVKHIVVPGGYCNQCHLFFILSDTYQKIIRIGTPICTIIEYHAYANHPKYYENNINSWNTQSLLKIFGYSVSQSSNLNENERHQILITIMRNGYLTKYQIVNYLQKFIFLHEGKSQDQSAVRKWKNDLDFVIGYSSAQGPVVGVKSINVRK